MQYIFVILHLVNPIHGLLLHLIVYHHRKIIRINRESSLFFLHRCILRWMDSLFYVISLSIVIMNLLPRLMNLLISILRQIVYPDFLSFRQSIPCIHLPFHLYLRVAYNPPGICLLLKTCYHDVDLSFILLSNHYFFGFAIFILYNY
jgi:hypothetical protein